MKKYVAIPLIILTVAFARPLTGAAVSVVLGEPPTVMEGLAQATTMVDETAKLAPTGSLTSPSLANPDPTLIPLLSNNHSLSDHSHLFSNSQYNDCDAFVNLFRDGWSTTYEVTVILPPGQGVDRFFTAVASFWASEGYDTLIANKGSTRPSVQANDDVATFTLRAEGRQIVISGTTRCLPPA